MPGDKIFHIVFSDFSTSVTEPGQSLIDKLNLAVNDCGDSGQLIKLVDTGVTYQKLIDDRIIISMDSAAYLTLLAMSVQPIEVNLCVVVIDLAVLHQDAAKLQQQFAEHLEFVKSQIGDAFQQTIRYVFTVNRSLSDQVCTRIFSVLQETRSNFFYTVRLDRPSRVDFYQQSFARIQRETLDYAGFFDSLAYQATGQSSLRNDPITAVEELSGFPTIDALDSDIDESALVGVTLPSVPPRYGLFSRSEEPKKPTSLAGPADEEKKVDQVVSVQAKAAAPETQQKKRYTKEPKKSDDDYHSSDQEWYAEEKRTKKLRYRRPPNP